MKNNKLETILNDKDIIRLYRGFGKNQMIIQYIIDNANNFPLKKKKEIPYHIQLNNRYNKRR